MFQIPGTFVGHALHEAVTPAFIEVRQANAKLGATLEESDFLCSVALQNMHSVKKKADNGCFFFTEYDKMKEDFALQNSKGEG